MTPTSLQRGRSSSRLPIPTSADFPDTKPDGGNGCITLAEWTRNRKCRREEIRKHKNAGNPNRNRKRRRWQRLDIMMLFGLDGDAFENPKLSEAVTAKGIVFFGPSVLSSAGRLAMQGER